MRQLARLATVAAAVVVAGVLVLPAPAAAETADQCHASINQYRASAGLDRASATSIPALAKAAANHAAYRVKVDTADPSLFQALGLPDLGLFGPDLTAHLESPKLTSLGFTGVNPWDRTRAAKLADGTWRYQYEDVTTATGIPAASLRGVRSWIDAPYHRLPNPGRQHPPRRLRRRPAGQLRRQVLEMAATWKDTTKRITLPGQGSDRRPDLVQPLPGAPHPVRRHLRRRPPDPAGRRRRHHPGRRLVRHEGPGHRLLQGRQPHPGGDPPRRPLPHHQVDRPHLVGRHQPPGQRRHARRPRPLAAATTYNVRVSGYVQATRGGRWVQFKTRVWSFTTA